MMGSKKLMITVDVEAQPARAARNHIDRLIWGRFSGHAAGGIGEMMDIADRHGAKIVMFLDYCERALYGDSILDVGREIHRRGHDLQLHSHPEFLAETFWTRRGLKRPVSMNSAEDAHAEALFEHLCQSQQDAGGTAPIGYRGGGYRYSAAVLRAMVRHGVKLDSSYISARENQPLKLGLIRQFYWDNGCLEMPVSCVKPFLNLNRVFDLNFNASAFYNAERMLKFLDIFYSQQGEDAIAVMVMHSWSFSRLQEDGFFSAPIAANLERFDEFLSRLKPAGIEVICTGDAISHVSSGRHTPAPTVAIENLKAADFAGSEGTPIPSVSTDKTTARKPSSMPDINAENITPVETGVMIEAKSAEHLACNVCGQPLASFEDFNGRAKARCQKCGSVERQRVFAQIYDEFLGKEFDLRSKRVLALSPSNAEKLIYSARAIADVVTLDIRPEIKPDIVADITNMPQIESSSFDAVIASYVMTCVHDLDAALFEISRILKPGARFLFCDPLKFNSETVDHQDPEKIVSWYGKEIYERYKVGGFRSLGDIGILRSLADAGFLSKTFYGRDPITGTIWIWHSAIKPCEVPGEKASQRGGDSAASVNRTAAAEKRWTEGDHAAAIVMHQRMFAQHDDPTSAYRLGTAYFLGKGAPRNLRLAWRYLSHPSQLNVRYACYYRGLILSDPSFDGYNPELARADLEKAARLGVPEATKVLLELTQNSALPNG